MKKIAKIIRNKEPWVFIVLIILVSLPAALPLFHSGFFHFSDEPHIANIFEMYRSLTSGQFPPRWAPDMLYGFGYPLFNFYYPLPFFLGSIFYDLTNSLITSYKLLTFLTIPLSLVGMYFWLKKHTDKVAAFAGSMVYLYTSYRAVDLYVRGALGENFSFAMAPFVALAVFEVINNKSKKWIGILGLAVGLFVLGHNLAPILFLPFMLLYALVLCYNRKDLKALIKVVSGIAIGLGISAFFWAPAFLEKGLLVGNTPFNYKDHFPFIKQLVYSSFRYGASNPGIGDDISLQVGLANWLLIVFSIPAFFIKKKKKKILFLVFFLTILASLFMMNIRSSFIWEVFSLSPYIQFPWRFLMLTTFLTSSLVIFINFKGNFRNYFFIFIALFAFLSSLNYFKPSEYFYPDDNYFLNRFFADFQSGKVSEEYKNYSEDYLILPKTVEEKPSSLPRAKVESSGVDIEKIEKRSLVDYMVYTKGLGALHFNSLYFPGWYIETDGQLQKPNIALPNGEILLKIDKETSNVHIYWKETPLRSFTDLVSLGSLTLSLFLIFNPRKNYAKKS